MVYILLSMCSQTIIFRKQLIHHILQLFMLIVNVLSTLYRIFSTFLDVFILLVVHLHIFLVLHLLEYNLPLYVQYMSYMLSYQNILFQLAQIKLFFLLLFLYILKLHQQLLFVLYGIFFIINSSQFYIYFYYFLILFLLYIPPIFFFFSSIIFFLHHTLLI